MSHDRVGREGHGMGYMGIWMGVDTPGSTWDCDVVF